MRPHQKSLTRPGATLLVGHQAPKVTAAIAAEIRGEESTLLTVSPKSHRRSRCLAPCSPRAARTKQTELCDSRVTSPRLRPTFSARPRSAYGSKYRLRKLSEMGRSRTGFSAGTRSSDSDRSNLSVAGRASSLKRNHQLRQQIESLKRPRLHPRSNRLVQNLLRPINLPRHQLRHTVLLRKRHRRDAPYACQSYEDRLPAVPPTQQAS